LIDGSPVGTSPIRQPSAAAPSLNPQPSTRLTGILPIVYTPFDADGAIDLEDLERLVDYLVDAGAHGLAAVGGASECHKLALEERTRLAEATVRFAADRVPVVIGTSAANTPDAVALSRHAESIGARAVFLTPPLYGPVTPEALRHHYGAVARAVSIPVMVQDAQTSVAPAQVVRLAEEFPNVCYAKEEAPLESGHRVSELKRLRPALNVLSGGSYLLDDLARGAQGAIPGSIGVADLARAYDLSVAGDRAGARAAFDHFTPLSFFRRQFPILCAKEVLRRLGVFKAARMRQPDSSSMDEQDQRELSAVMERMGPPY
jgi:4-hydroxy-tetrahydrodipicolinate synthase